MQETQRNFEKKSFSRPDGTTSFPNARVDTVRVGQQTVKRYTLQPGMRWERDVKPVAQTPSCEIHHMAVQHSGRTHFRFSNGQELELGPGDVADIPAGHDKWTVGDEPAVFISFE